MEARKIIAIAMMACFGIAVWYECVRADGRSDIQTDQGNNKSTVE